MLSDKEKEKIKKEAQEILIKFAGELEKVEDIGEIKEEKLESCREEKSGEKCDELFRKAMFKNAPDVEGDCLVMEKKKW